MKPKFRSLVAAFAPLSRTSLIVCASLCAVPQVNAAKTWSGATDAGWATLTNWVEGALPGTTETVIFDSNSTANLTAIALGGNRTVKGITLTTPASDVTIASGSTLNLNGGIIDLSAASANFTCSAGLNLAATAQQDWTVATGRSITLASLGRTTSGGPNNLNVGASLTLPTTGGTIKVGAVAIAVFADTQGNPFATYGLDNWAGTDATGNVVGSTNTAWNASIGTVFQGPSVVTGSFTQTGNGGTSSMLFADTVTAHTLTLASATTFTGRGVLVASNSVGGTITGGFFRPNRVSSGAGGNSPMNFVQNSTLGDLTVASNISNASSSTPVSVVKSGVGKMVATGPNSYTGGTFVNQGTLQVGSGGTAGSISTSSNVVIQSGASVVMNLSADATLNAVLGGSGTFTQQGSGTTTLGGASAGYTGTLNINGGAIAATSLANIGSGTTMGINGGTLKFLGVFDPTSKTIALGSSGATFNTNGNNISFAGGFTSGSTGSLTKTGAGSLTLTSSSDYSGGTTVTAGSLLAFNASGTATGTGPVSVNTGGTIGGTGTISGTVTVASGGNLAPGASVGTLTVGGLVLASGSTGTFEFNATPANDAVAVTSSGGLTLSGGAITLLQEGSASPFNTPGTYNLFSYSGSLGGSVSSLSVANPQPGYTYAFSADGSNVKLTIGTVGTVSEWANTGGGTWGTAGNWTAGVPDGTGATANFFNAITAPSVVTLDGAKTVGAVSFNNGTNGYTIAQGSGGSLTINNGSNPSAISNNDGVHEISAPVTLTTNTAFSTGAADDITTLSGVVSGAGTVTKSGPGGLSLLGNNLMTGAVTLNGGTTTFANGGLGSGNLSISGASLVWSPGNSQDISNRVVTFGSNPVTFDTNGNNVALLTSVVGGGGTASFTKTGLGKLTFGETPTFTGIVTISAGVLQLGNGGATGVVSGSITDNAELDINLADGSVFSNVVSGTGSLVHAGSGTLTLGAANTHSGTTSISSGSGTLLLSNILNIQNSTLDYSASGGALSFGSLTAATFGGISGNKNLTLENTTPAAVALTIGNNGQAATYSGSLSGSGSLTKVGAGISTLAGASAYTGATNVNAGTLDLGTGGSINGTTVTVATTGTLSLSSPTSALTLSGLCNLANNSGSAVLVMQDGTATLNGDIQALGNANQGYRIEVNGGTLTTPNVRLGRGSLSFTTEAAAIGSTTQGLYVNGGAVSISGVLEMAVNGSSNSSVSTFVNAGSLTVGGKTTIGLNNGGRWSVLQVSGGSFTSTDAVDGVVLGAPAVGNALFAVSGGTATVERIQFGQGVLAGTSLLRLTSGELYVGSGGIRKVSANNVSEIRCQGGTLGAKATWDTAMPVNLTGTASTVSTFKAADALNMPFHITITGVLGGDGSLEKTGDGTLTLARGNSSTGNTLVSAGTLKVQARSFNDDASLSVEAVAGALLNLDFTGGDRVAVFNIDGSAQPDGIYGSMTNTTPGINHTPAIIGSGLLYVNTEVPPSPYDSWATLKGLTVANNGPTDDPDKDGISNALEFVLGGDPLASTPGILPTLAVGPTDFVFSFTRSDESEQEVSLTFQYGSNLSGWTPVVVGADTASSGTGVVVSENGTAADTITVTIPKGANTELFGRLKADQ